MLLVDRKKDMYISGGENVYPAGVEDVLMKYNKIADAGVIGIPDDKMGRSWYGNRCQKKPHGSYRERGHRLLQEYAGQVQIPKKVVFTDALPARQQGKSQEDTQGKVSLK